MFQTKTTANRYHARIWRNRIRRSRILMSFVYIFTIARIIFRGNKASLIAALSLPVLATAYVA